VFWPCFVQFISWSFLFFLLIFIEESYGIYCNTRVIQKWFGLAWNTGRHNDSFIITLQHTVCTYSPLRSLHHCHLSGNFMMDTANHLRDSTRQLADNAL
jgi:hypothetical protein